VKKRKCGWDESIGANNLPPDHLTKSKNAEQTTKTAQDRGIISASLGVEKQNCKKKKTAHKESSKKKKKGKKKKRKGVKICRV